MQIQAMYRSSPIRFRRIQDEAPHYRRASVAFLSWSTDFKSNDPLDAKTLGEKRVCVVVVSSFVKAESVAQTEDALIG